LPKRKIVILSWNECWNRTWKGLRKCCRTERI